MDKKWSIWVPLVIAVFITGWYLSEQAFSSIDDTIARKEMSDQLDSGTIIEKTIRQSFSKDGEKLESKKYVLIISSEVEIRGNKPSEGQVVTLTNSIAIDKETYDQLEVGEYYESSSENENS